MARGHGAPSASARPRRPAPVPKAQHGGAARRPAPPRPMRGPGSPPASACPAPARRGLELGQRVAPRDRPRRGPVAARGVQHGSCAARPRRVRGPS
jgi:hypothetical protein